MLALVYDYPTDYTIDPNAVWVSDDPGAPAAVVSQMIAWICTDEYTDGFYGGDDWVRDLRHFRTVGGYYNLMMNAFAELDPDIHEYLNSPIAPNCEAYQNDMRNQAEKFFYDLWTAANMTSKLEANWDKEISTYNVAMREEDGMYHADIDLFVSEKIHMARYSLNFQSYYIYHR